jgi:predicted nucleic acid-binding protein
MYVLDTDVFSLTSPTSGFVAPEAEAWRRWVRRNEGALYFSVATIMEVRFGIEKSMAKGATKKAARLRLWLNVAETVHRNRIIPVTIEIAHRAGELLYRAVAAGMASSPEDAIIAATADVNGFTVLSRNAGDMKALYANWSNPLKAIPPDAPPAHAR